MPPYLPSDSVPTGILVTPDRWDRGIPTLQDMLREYLRRNQGTQHPNLRVIHRLDKDTSGAIVLAKNVKAQSNVSKQFESGEISKSYYAIVKGDIPQNEGIINFSLSESSREPGKMTVNPKGKKSITLFNVVERFDGFALVEAKPLTGRTHQVRVHFNALGYPLQSILFTEIPSRFTCRSLKKITNRKIRRKNR